MSYARDAGHDDAMRRVASRLVGILHACVKAGAGYDKDSYSYGQGQSSGLLAFWPSWRIAPAR